MRIGIIGGSGLGDALLDGVALDDRRVETPETPFGATSGPITIGRRETRGGSVDVALLSRHGHGHLLNPAAVPYRANIFALKALGCTHVVASGACGSLRESIRPGDLVVCDQLLDRTDGRPRTFFERAAVHVEFSEPFCPVVRRWLLGAAKAIDDRSIHDGGTYVCVEGPSFSTIAEAAMHRTLGADVVGMTALPEARLAREAELPYALLALPTDDDCWRPRPAGTTPESLLAEIIGNLKRAVDGSIALLQAALSDLSILKAESSPVDAALSMAIWSDRAAIDRREVDRLKPLWGKYFD